MASFLHYKRTHAMGADPDYIARGRIPRGHNLKTEMDYAATGHR